LQFSLSGERLVVSVNYKILRLFRMEYRAVVSYRNEYKCSICGHIILKEEPHLKESTNNLPARICEPCSRKYNIWGSPVELEYIYSNIFPS